MQVRHETYVDKGGWRSDTIAHGEMAKFNAASTDAGGTRRDGERCKKVRERLRVRSTISLVSERILFRGQVEILRRPLHRDHLLLCVREAVQALNVCHETRVKETAAAAKHVGSGYLERQPFSICVMGKAYVTASPSYTRKSAYDTHV